MRTVKAILGGGLAAAAVLVLPGAATAAALKVTVDDLASHRWIAGTYTFCVPAAKGHVTFGGDRNPRVSWSAGPAGTRSYAVITVDPDVPSVGTNVNKEGRTLSPDLKRIDFYHWVLVDIPASVTTIPEGADADGVTPHGKPPGPAKIGVRGINDYTKWFAGDAKMKGEYGGYDGPCPPWNDPLLHHYHFTVYALDVPSLGLHGTFDGPAARKAMQGHVLAKGEVVGVYSLNPSLQPDKTSQADTSKP